MECVDKSRVRCLHESLDHSSRQVRKLTFAQSGQNLHWACFRYTVKIPVDFTVNTRNWMPVPLP